MTRSRRFFASSPWIATGTPDYVNLGYTSRDLAEQALMRLSRKSLTIFRKLGLVVPIAVRAFPAGNDRLIGVVLVGVVPARDLLIAESFHGVSTDSLNFCNTLDDVHRETETIDFVLNR